MDSRLVGDLASLELKEHHVSLSLDLTGKNGHAVVDYREHSSFCEQVGTRALIHIRSPVVATFATVTRPDAGYDVALVHHSRDNSSKPTSVASVLAQHGAVLLTRSQALFNITGTVGFAHNVTSLIQPDPLHGVSPRLVVYWQSFGIADKDVARVVIKFSVDTSGDATPDFS